MKVRRGIFLFSPRKTVVPSDVIMDLHDGAEYLNMPTQAVDSDIVLTIEF
jgi:hypothetical protein